VLNSGENKETWRFSIIERRDEMSDNLNEILQRQQDAISLIKSEIDSVAQSDMSRESAALRQEIEKINAQQRTAMEKLRDTQESSFNYKTRLFKQLSDTLDRQQDTLFLLEGEIAAIAENDFIKHSAAMKQEIENLKTEHDAVMNKITAEHDAVMDRITVKYEIALEKLSEETEIEKLKSEHKNTLKTIEVEYNAAIEKMVMEQKATAAKLREEQQKNADLKNKIYEQLFSEKISFINNVEEKINIYFNDTHREEINRLNCLSKYLNEKITQMRIELRRNSVEISDEVFAKLNDVTALADKKIAEVREKNARLAKEFISERDKNFKNLMDEQITDEQINEVTKKNNLEAFIGVNLVNKIGIFLIIIGFILLSRFVYENISDVIRGILMFTAGGLMLGVGEFLNRRSKIAGVASLGLSAGGIAVLYISGAVCYFTFGILGMYSALIICVMITSAAFFLSMRYNSQTITAFALIGGYMPIFAIPDGGLPIIYGAMVYFVILNCLALLISYYKKWNVCYFIGFSLNLIGTIFIIALSLGALNMDELINKHALVIYVFFAFLVYTAVPVISTFRTRQMFKTEDIILLGLNTVISSFIIYILFYALEFGDYTGIISVAFAAVYLSLGWIVMKTLHSEKNVSALFYLTGLTFVILFIPFQFNIEWFSLGWLIQGTLLSVYGIVKEKKSFIKSGFFINALCLATFILVDMPPGSLSQNFSYKYFAVTLASLIILASFIYKKQQFLPNQTVFRILTALNLPIYIIYFMSAVAYPRLLDIFSESMSQKMAENLSNYITGTVFVLAAFLLARVLSRSLLVADGATRKFALCLYVIGVIVSLFINGVTGSFYVDEPTVLVVATGTMMMVLSNIVALMGLNDFIKEIILGKKLGVEFYPIIVSAFFVLLLTQNLMVQFYLQFSSMIVSMIFAVTAVLWIVFGFMKRYSYIRRFGLALSMFSVVKLIIFDLWGQTEGYRIILFIFLGAALVVISLVYQYFVKKLSADDEIR